MTLARSTAPLRRPALGLTLLAGAALLTLTTPAPALAQSDDAIEAPSPSCQRFRDRYLRSAARKLGRAVRSQDDHQSTPLDLPKTVDLTLDGRAITFKVLVERDGHSAALVSADHDHPTTYVVAGADDSFIVASHRWPTPRQLADGDPCRPISSQIESPDVLTRTIRLNPFNYWGFRVTWRIPAQLGRPHGPVAQQLADIMTDD